MRFSATVGIGWPPFLQADRNDYRRRNRGPPPAPAFAAPLLTGFAKQQPKHGFVRQLLDRNVWRATKARAGAGLPLAGFYYCPHHPDGRVQPYAAHCFCRKPHPGMLFQAGRDHNLNLAACWMVGDILDDIEAGRRADCSTVLIDNGNETQWLMFPLRRPHHMVKNLFEAARVILDSAAPTQPSRMEKSMQPPNFAAGSR